jgi:hypothetical protein
MLLVISLICFSIWLFAIAGGQTFHGLIHLFAALGALSLILTCYGHRAKRNIRNPDPLQQRQASPLLKRGRK